MLLSVIAAAIREDRQWKKLQSAMLKAMAVSTPAPRNIRLRLRAWARLSALVFSSLLAWLSFSGNSALPTSSS